MKKRTQVTGCARKLFREDVKICKTRVLKVSLQCAYFYPSYSRKTERFDSIQLRYKCIARRPATPSWRRVMSQRLRRSSGHRPVNVPISPARNAEIRNAVRSDVGVTVNCRFSKSVWHCATYHGHPSPRFVRSAPGTGPPRSRRHGMDQSPLQLPICLRKTIGQLCWCETLWPSYGSERALYLMCMPELCVYG